MRDDARSNLLIALILVFIILFAIWMVLIFEVLNCVYYDPTDISIQSNSSLIVEPISNNRIHIMSEALPSSESDSNTVRLTSNVSFADPYDWTINFVDPTSEWAAGKSVTNYVTITEVESDLHVVDVNCVQPFKEQIVVKLSSRSDPNAIATCTVDYGVRRDLNGLVFEIKETAYNFCGANIIPELTTYDGTIYSNNSTSLTIGFTDAYQVLIDSLIYPMYKIDVKPVRAFNSYLVGRQLDYMTLGRKLFGFSNLNSYISMTFMDVRSSAENYNFQLGKLLGLYSFGGSISSTINGTINALTAREQNYESLRKRLMSIFNDNFLEERNFLHTQIGAQFVQLSADLYYYIIPDLVEIRYSYMSNNQQITKVFKHDFIIAPFVLT